ncbi:MAG: hypothetical protein ACP5T3_02445 [Candidatus Micrarchaeia archaeon]
MSFYGLFLLGVAVASAICMASVSTLMRYAGPISIGYARTAESVALGVYSNYLASAPNGSYAVGALSEMSGVYVRCARSMCVVENKYLTAYEVVPLNDTG